MDPLKQRLDVFKAGIREMSKEQRRTLSELYLLPETSEYNEKFKNVQKYTAKEIYQFRKTRLKSLPLSLPPLHAKKNKSQLIRNELYDSMAKIDSFISQYPYQITHYNIHTEISDSSIGNNAIIYVTVDIVPEPNKKLV